MISLKNKYMTSFTDSDTHKRIQDRRDQYQINLICSKEKVK